MGPEILLAAGMTAGAAEGVAMAGTAATVGGGLLQAFGKIFEGNAAANKFKYQAGIARMNQMINKQNADYERVIGEREAQKSGMKTGLTMGKIQTAQAAQGGLVGEGSSADVLESQHAIGEYDQSTIRWSAAKRAYGYEVKAAEDESSSKMLEKGATNAKIASWIGAGSSLLGTAGSVANKWLDAKKYGLFSEGTPKAMSGTTYYGEGYTE